MVRALVLEAPRRLVVRQPPALPRIGDDDALVRVEATGLCGTDHGNEYTPGSWPVGLPSYLATGSGRLRPSVRGRSSGGAMAGDRAVEVFQSCRQCANCRGGEYRRCVRQPR